MQRTAYGTPLVIRDGESPVVLDREPISSGPDSTYGEAYLQKLAFEHPSCLPIAAIDRAYEDLIPVCMELNTPAGRLDALYVTPAGRLVILEAKLWRNPEARRKVVSQILDYAKEFSRWDYEDLQREVSRKLGRKGNALFELVAERHPDADEAQFVDEVSQTLARGRFLLLIVGDGIREGAGAIAEFLGNAGSLEFTFGLVELAVYRHADVGVLVQPRVLARTVELQRLVVQLPEGATLEAPDVQPAREDAGLSDEAVFYQTFWQEFLDSLRLDDASQPLANPTKSQNIYFPLPPAGGSSWVSAYFAKSSESVGVYLRMSKKVFGDDVFQALLEDRENIEEELGFIANWEERENLYSVAVRKSLPDFHDAKYREEIKDFFATAVNQFVNVFRPRIERVVERG